jgi:hypothetical protein
MRMALEDIADLIGVTKRQDIIVKILQCFEGGNNPTFEDIQAELSNVEKMYPKQGKGDTGVSKNMLRWYLQKLRKWNIIFGFRDDTAYRYQLDPRGAKGKLEGKIIDSLKYLVQKKGE